MVFWCLILESKLLVEQQDKPQAISLHRQT